MDTPTTEFYTLSLHDALPISARAAATASRAAPRLRRRGWRSCSGAVPAGSYLASRYMAMSRRPCESRSEEHTSELQSHVKLVCRLLPEKKNHHPTQIYILTQ